LPRLVPKIARRHRSRDHCGRGITTIEEIRELERINVHSALGMAIYTSRLNLEELARLFAAH
jgi:phosphoribosylformimino-5-aminoimidazole carboxamide ribonucleotide (ProFAR) isomerase